MYTSLVLIALSGTFVPLHAVPSPVAWHHDYGQASRQGQSLKRPLAVFLAPGANGWDKLSKEGGLGQPVKELLHESYVCLHIDTSTEEGRRWARRFEMYDGLGLVLSDARGEKQAFWHDGTLNGDDLRYYLRKFADPKRVVLATETTPDAAPLAGSVSYPATPAVSVSAAPGTVVPAYAAPAFAAPAYYSAPVYAPRLSGGFSSRGC